MQPCGRGWAGVVGCCRRGRRRPALRLRDKRANARRDGFRVARHPRLLKVLGSSSRVSSACHARLARAHAGRRVVRFVVEQENTKPNRMATDGITHRLHAQPLDARCTAWRGVPWHGRCGAMSGCLRSPGSTPSCRCTTMTRSASLALNHCEAQQPSAFQRCRIRHSIGPICRCNRTHAPRRYATPHTATLVAQAIGTVPAVQLRTHATRQQNDQIAVPVHFSYDRRSNCRLAESLAAWHALLR